jgi:hypothetical protein
VPLARIKSSELAEPLHIKIDTDDAFAFITFTATMVLTATGPLIDLGGMAAPEVIKALAGCATNWQVRENMKR